MYSMDVDLLETFEKRFLVLHHAVEMAKDGDARPKHWRLQGVNGWLECPPDEEEQSACCQTEDDGLGQKQFGDTLCQCHAVLTVCDWVVFGWKVKYYSA